MTKNRQVCLPEVVVCPRCGKVWTRTTTKKGRMCVTCRNARWRKRYSINADCTKVGVALASLRTARKKPKGISDIRWRLELRRRANPEYYAEFGMDV